jgi:very-short-patch-repair endonuclease
MSHDFEFLLLEQHDVFTGAQARRLGISHSVIRAQVAANRWQRVGNRVLVAHTGPLDDVANLWVAVLWCGDGACLSHATAAHLQGLVSSAPDEIHVTVPESRHPAARAGLTIHRTRNAMPRETGRRLPQRGVDDTVLDRCDNAKNADEVIALVVSAISKRRTTSAQLATALAGRQRARWRDLLRDLLHDGEGIESALEWRYRRDVERAHGLPSGTRQQVIAVGVRHERRDVVYEQWRVVVELDGRLGHEGVGAFRDMQRDNAAAVRGEVALRYGWTDVAGDPCRVARQLAAILTERGWPGKLRRCVNCPPVAMSGGGGRRERRGAATLGAWLNRSTTRRSGSSTAASAA